MLLSREKLSHINTFAHEGKVIVVVTDERGLIWYTVKQDGFEDSYLTQPPEKRTGWEGWQELEFPDESDDVSVISRQAEDFTKQSDPDDFLMRSRYKTPISAIAPVQLISAQGHVYVFRQSDTNKLWVDRFVLDGLTNTLVRKLEVRVKRSRQKHSPSKLKKQESKRFVDIDSLDFTDINGQNFYEPTTELGMAGTLDDGLFSVVQLPTDEHDKHCWHIFIANREQNTVKLVSLRVSDEGLFDIRDYTVLEPEARTLPGIIHHTLSFGAVRIAKGIAATRFDKGKFLVADLCGGPSGTVNGAVVGTDKQLPICGDALVCAEYSTVGKDRTAMMRRFYATVQNDGVELLAGGRIGLLELKWIGNGQFAPTLLGYIEGAPPAPSENLTLEDDYREATSVELDLSTDVEFNWTRAQDAGLGASIDA